MKLDDRDIICEQDYTTLSNAELVEAIERYAAIMHTAPLVDFDLEWITGPARVLLARVEAAEALAYERLESALFAEQRASDAEIERDSANVEAALEQSNAREAWIRVAELETQLAEQQWRPGSETPPADWYQTAETDVFSYAYFTGATWHGHPDDLPPLWYRPIPPLPPAPDTEPTP